MVELHGKRRQALLKMFEYTEETLILSCVQGHMGRAWADSEENPVCAQIVGGDFCFLAGDHESPSAGELVGNIPGDFKSPNLIVAPQNDMWGNLVRERYAGKFKHVKRYAIHKHKDNFNKEKLQEYVNGLSSEYELRQIDLELCGRSKENDFSKDFCSLFDSPQDYVKRGLGFCILRNNMMVCGASSYSVYDGGIEIEIATKEEFRRKGLALICAAELMLECFKRGLYPSWDAANIGSMRLAEKLGYIFNHEYDTYLIDLTK